MSKHDAPEQRTATAPVSEMRAEGNTLHGYAALYGVETALDGFTEIIQRGAFADALGQDTYLTFNHSPDKVLARTTSGTLRLHDEERGLRFEADLGDGPTAQDVRSMVRRGDVTGASFRFAVGRDGERWSGDKRTLTKIERLIDLSLATTPAYDGPKVELRHRPEATSTPTAADEPQEKSNDMSDESKTEERSDAPDQAEERKAPDAKVTNEPAPQLKVEQRSEAPEFHSLAKAFEQRGFPGETASVTWDEYRTASFMGGTANDLLSPIRRDGVALGYDSRWAFPAFQQISVGADVTSVQVLRQNSRTLVAGTATVRAIDAVSTKPEVATAAEVVTVPLKQVAAIESNVPNVVLEQNTVESLVETDLRLQHAEGLDSLVQTAFAGSSNQAPGSDQLLVSIRKAAGTIEASGYLPDTLILRPADAITLDTLTTAGTATPNDYVYGAGVAAVAPFGLTVRISKSVPAPVVVDSNAFGKLYSSPVTLARFEVDAGATNRSNIRLENHAAFGVERQAAAIRIAAS